LSGFSPDNNPKRRDGNFSCTDGHLEAPQPVSEEGKMGMIAFYAGLFVGILFGLLFSSLWAFSLARRKAGALPDQAEALTPANLLEP
jgi:hypothetical protein